MSLEIILAIVGIAVSLASAFWAYLSAKAARESLKLMVDENELARPCIAETRWEAGRSDFIFCTICIVSGRNFAQIKSIAVHGYKLSTVRHMTIERERVSLSCCENKEVLPLCKSIPPGAPMVQIKVAISPIPVPPFEIEVELARGERSIVYRVTESVT